MYLVADFLKRLLYIKRALNEFKWWISKEALSETVFCLIYSNIFNPEFGGIGEKKKKEH